MIPHLDSESGPSLAHLNGHISIVLMDDHTARREGVLALMHVQPGFRVLATSAEIGEALRQVREVRPDLVLLHLSQEGDDGLALSGALHGEAPGSRVVLMGVQASEADVARYLRAGVSGFIMAGASFEICLDTVRSVAQGVQVLPAELTRALFVQLKNHGVQGQSQRMLDIPRLSDREREIANLIVLGRSNREIATLLEIAVHTVKSHVHKVLGKLAINSRLEVAASMIPSG